MNTLENVKQWFIDRDLEYGGTFIGGMPAIYLKGIAKWVCVD